MPTTFVRSINAASAQQNNGAVDLPLISISRTTGADQINTDHSARAVHISRPGNPAPDQHRGRHHNQERFRCEGGY